ncbi:hypothetical protein CSUI_000576 [Cystoisospora suis]|uniref:Uncharacterized protein n=1 Tax=Cystoisospora suis TaxID=483139 RepID=A0A2C6LG25_9APIC|nr:hypothetical protein CSUI_000576 [Cystoisospora suis]
MKPPRNSVRPGKPPPPASSAPDSAAGNVATGSRTASTAVAGGGSMDMTGPLSDEWRLCTENLSHSLVRGLPLLLQPHQVEAIWRAAAAEELSKAATSKAQERQSASPRSSTPATEAETLQPHLPPSSEGQNLEPAGSRGPSDLHQAAVVHTQRSVTGTAPAGKKGSGAMGRDSVAKVGKEGPNFSSFSKGPGPGAGGSGSTPPGWGSGSSKLRPESAASGFEAEGETGKACHRFETEGVYFRETTCAILRLGSEGRRNPVVVDFHLFNLLFARQMKLSAAKTALFVSIMGAALAQLERDARVIPSISLDFTDKSIKG